MVMSKERLRAGAVIGLGACCVSVTDRQGACTHYTFIKQQVFQPQSSTDNSTFCAHLTLTAIALLWDQLLT